MTGRISQEELISIYIRDFWEDYGPILYLNAEDYDNRLTSMFILLPQDIPFLAKLVDKCSYPDYMYHFCRTFLQYGLQQGIFQNSTDIEYFNNNCESLFINCELYRTIVRYEGDEYEFYFGFGDYDI